MVYRVLLAAGLTGIFWVVPTMATQGMGTIDARIDHPDAPLIDTPSTARAAARVTLQRADAMVEAATAATTV